MTRPPLAVPVTLDFDKVWIVKPERARLLLDVLSSEEISALLAPYALNNDLRFSDDRTPLIHGSDKHDSTVEMTASKNAANGYAGLDGAVKLNGAQLPYGTAQNTACEGNDARLLTMLDSRSRVWSSLLPNVATAITLASGTAYFVYLGRTVTALTPKYVEFHVNTAGSGAQTAEVGFFSSANSPNKGAQSLTKIESTGTVDALNTIGVKRNTAAFSTSVTAGTHLWAGIRTAMATAQPAIMGLCMDWSQGRVLSTAGAGVLTGAGPWTGAIIAVAAYQSTAVCPDLRGVLD
jgi:hypothetical protein